MHPQHQVLVSDENVQLDWKVVVALLAIQSGICRVKLSIATVLVRKLAAMLTVTASPPCIHNNNAHLYLNRRTVTMLSMHNLLSQSKAVAHWAQALTPQQMWHIHVSMAKLPQTHRCTRACPMHRPSQQLASCLPTTTHNSSTLADTMHSVSKQECAIRSCSFRKSCLKTSQVVLHHEKEEEGYLHI